MLTKNQSLSLECTALGASFEGICRHAGQVIFVPGALPGERLTAKIIKVTKSYAVGRLERLETFSADRVKPPCPYARQCGGCTAQHLAYPATLAHKRTQVTDCLTRIGHLAVPEVEDTLGMDNPWRYRNKGAFPVGGTAAKPVIGCYAARSHDIVDAPAGCLLQSETSDALVSAVRKWIVGFGISPYQEAAHTGLLRHVMTREAKDGSAMLVLVVNGQRVPHVDQLIQYALDAAPKLRSIILAENTARTNVILGDRFITLWGEDTLEDTIASLRMRVSPRSFFQVNPLQAERLYNVALRYCQLSGAERVWDVYCGCGSITLPLAGQAASVVGIEVVKDAVEDARHNAQLGGIKNVTFLAGAAEDLLPSLAREQGLPDVIVVDPPRKGCDEAVLAAMMQAAPERIVYVSCNPATLARDAGVLAEKYRLEAVQPVDMFGWTGHVESVVSLKRV